MPTWDQLAQGCYQSAEILRAQKQWRGCINRAYYAGYCSVSAQLAAKGIQFARGWNNPAHEQIIQLVRNGLSLSFVTRKQIDQALRRLRHAREDAYYRPAITVDELLAVSCLRDASFVLRIMKEGER